MPKARTMLGAMLVFAAGMVIFSGISYAQTTANAGAVTMKMQPALFEQTVNPGDRFSTSVTVTNPGTGAQQLTVGVQDISGVNEAGQPIFSSSSVPEYGVSSWVQLNTSEITVPAGGSVNIPFTIVVPQNAGPGGHYGAIFVSFGATRPTFNGSGLGYEVGSLIELRIAGNATEQAQINEFSTDKSLYQTPTVNFTATVLNQGNVLLQPYGPIDITNMFGQKVATVVVNSNGASVFPGAARSFAVSWTGNGLAFGQYTAVMTLNYGDTTNKTISASTSFWVIPVIPIVVVLLSILFFILLFVWSVKAYVRKRVNSMVHHGEHGGRASSSDEQKLLSESGLPLSRLVFIVIATAIFAVIFLAILFFLFG